jgi:hypothetical protein
MSGNYIETLLDALGEHDARAILAECGTRVAIREFERECAVRQAINLLRQRVHRSVIRDRLMTSYGYSWSTAYRVINSALSKVFQTRIGHEIKDTDDCGS